MPITVTDDAVVVTGTVSNTEADLVSAVTTVLGAGAVITVAPAGGSSSQGWFVNIGSRTLTFGTPTGSAPSNPDLHSSYTTQASWDPKRLTVMSTSTKVNGHMTVYADASLETDATVGAPRGSITDTTTLSALAATTQPPFLLALGVFGTNTPQDNWHHSSRSVNVQNASVTIAGRWMANGISIKIDGDTIKSIEGARFLFTNGRIVLTSAGGAPSGTEINRGPLAQLYGSATSSFAGTTIAGPHEMLINGFEATTPLLSDFSVIGATTGLSAVGRTNAPVRLIDPDFSFNAFDFGLENTSEGSAYNRIEVTNARSDLSVKFNLGSGTNAAIKGDWRLYKQVTADISDAVSGSNLSDALIYIRDTDNGFRKTLPAITKIGGGQGASTAQVADYDANIRSQGDHLDNTYLATTNASGNIGSVIYGGRFDTATSTETTVTDSSPTGGIMNVTTAIISPDTTINVVLDERIGVTPAASVDSQNTTMDLRGNTNVLGADLFDIITYHYLYDMNVVPNAPLRNRGAYNHERPLILDTNITNTTLTGTGSIDAYYTANPGLVTETARVGTVARSTSSGGNLTLNSSATMNEIYDWIKYHKGQDSNITNDIPRRDLFSVASNGTTLDLTAQDTNDVNRTLTLANGIDLSGTAGSKNTLIAGDLALGGNNDFDNFNYTGSFSGSELGDVSNSEITTTSTITIGGSVSNSTLSTSGAVTYRINGSVTGGATLSGSFIIGNNIAFTGNNTMDGNISSIADTTAVFNNIAFGPNFSASPTTVPNAIISATGTTDLNTMVNGVTARSILESAGYTVQGLPTTITVPVPGVGIFVGSDGTLGSLIALPANGSADVRAASATLSAPLDFYFQPTNNLSANIAYPSVRVEGISDGDSNVTVGVAAYPSVLIGTLQSNYTGITVGATFFDPTNDLATFTYNVGASPTSSLSEQQSKHFLLSLLNTDAYLQVLAESKSRSTSPSTTDPITPNTNGTTVDATRIQLTNSSAEITLNNVVALGGNLSPDQTAVLGGNNFNIQTFRSLPPTDGISESQVERGARTAIANSDVATITNQQDIINSVREASLGIPSDTTLTD